MGRGAVDEGREERVWGGLKSPAGRGKAGFRAVKKGRLPVPRQTGRVEEPGPRPLGKMKTLPFKLQHEMRWSLF